MIYIVLGMGFSGTTLVSELMHHSGVAMIDAEEDRYDSGGKYEHPDFQDINKDLLDLKDDQVMYLRPQHCPTALNAMQSDNMHRLVDHKLEQHMSWGFKDPRSVVTYPLWCGVLPRHKVIAVYRDPAGNWPRHRWRGYRRRYFNGWRALVHLRQWCEYNEAIMKYGALLDVDFLLLNYERMMSGDEELTRMREFLGRDIEDRRKPAMFRTRSSGDYLFRIIRQIMDRTGPWRPCNTMDKLEKVRAKQITRNQTLVKS